MVIKRDSLLRFFLFLLVVTVIALYLTTGGEQPEEVDVLGEAPEEEPAVVVTAPAESLDALVLEQEGDFFTDFAYERQQALSQQLEWLEEVMSNPDAAAVAREKASEEYLALTRRFGLQVELEGLIEAKGFEDAIVVLFEDHASVTVRASELTPLELARIMEIIRQGTGLEPGQISVSARVR